MSLPAYMYIYDENGQQIKGSCMALGREGAIEVMNSGYSMYQVTCSSTGKLTGARQHTGSHSIKILIKHHLFLPWHCAKVGVCKKL